MTFKYKITLLYLNMKLLKTLMGAAYFETKKLHSYTLVTKRQEKTITSAVTVILGGTKRYLTVQYNHGN